MSEEKKDFYVHYEVKGFGKEHDGWKAAGPYKSYDIADEHRQDIISSPGVYGSYVSELPPKEKS